LFFTIITSNAVSIASVVILAKGGTGAPAQQQQQGTDVNQQQQNNNNYVDNSATNNGGVQDNSAANNADANNAGANNAGTNNAGTNNGGATNNNTPTNKPADANDPVLKDPLGFYQKAAKDIHLNGTAGYNKIGWQKILKIEGLGMLSGAIEGIIAGFMTTEEEAEVKENPKGSDDAKNRMPISDCDKKYVKSATAKKDGANYVITIVLVEQTNPSYKDADGLVKMSREFLDYGDVQEAVKDISIVKSLDGQIVYKDYTITAVMTADGKFVSITHQGVGYIKANLNGSINANGELEFNAKYTDFKY
jgi:hypothetical protein